MINMINKIINGIAIAIFSVVVIVAILVLSNPLRRRSEERIRTVMLNHTPIGMSMDEVIGVIENNDNWEIRRTRDHGYAIRSGVPDITIMRGDKNIVGVKAMEVTIGSYNFFFVAGKMTVYVFYAFDEDSKLIDIAVVKLSMHI